MVPSLPLERLSAIASVCRCFSVSEKPLDGVLLKCQEEGAGERVEEYTLILLARKLPASEIPARKCKKLFSENHEWFRSPILRAENARSDFRNSENAIGFRSSEPEMQQMILVNHGNHSCNITAAMLCTTSRSYRQRSDELRCTFEIHVRTTIMTKERDKHRRVPSHF